MELTTKIDNLKGGEFLVKDSNPADIFTPEDFSDDQMMVVNMVRDFIKAKVLPVADKIEKLDLELTRKLIQEMGELGILGIPFPEQYGGSEMDFVTNIILTELMSETQSFALSYGAHTSIGLMPILYFGNDDQKEKYLPGLIDGTKCAAYCLTEPGSGSDAMAAKSHAKLNEEGTHYILNGQKMWITNAGFADVFTVFAKIDGDKFTAFIVEAAWEGVTTGAEEDKMGVKGSSTRQVFFENVKVPVGNVLGAIAKGHKIAFNILNIGRIKLAAGAVGASKVILDKSIEYANQRHQFQKPISSFGAIQHKLAEMALNIFVNESAVYRASQSIKLMEEDLLDQGKSLNVALLGGAEEYSIECAILKVSGSECLDFCADEGVQIFGGMGYSEEAPMAAAYRNARINRIFEGTNEINRMLAVERLLKKAMTGKIDLLSNAKAVQKEIMSMPSFGEESNGITMYKREKLLIKNMKKAFLLVSGATVQHFMQALEKEQEIMMNISDMITDIYLCESAILRTEKIHQVKGEDAAAIYADMTQVFIDDAMERVTVNGKRAICGWAEGDMLRTLLLGLRRFNKYEAVNSKSARRRIAAKLIENGKYCY